MIGDTRGVSVAITHALMLGVTAVLITGLLIGAGSLLQTQSERAASQQIDEIATDILGLLETYDRLNASAERAQTGLVLEYPPTIVGEPYTVGFREESGPYSTDWTLQIDAATLPGSEMYPIPNETSVLASSARGTEPRLSQCSNGTVTFGRC